jgi:hypothetical protein
MCTSTTQIAAGVAIGHRAEVGEQLPPFPWPLERFL